MMHCHRAGPRFMMDSVCAWSAQKLLEFRQPLVRYAKCGRLLWHAPSGSISPATTTTTTKKTKTVTLGNMSMHGNQLEFNKHIFHCIFENVSKAHYKFPIIAAFLGLSYICTCICLYLNIYVFAYVFCRFSLFFCRGSFLSDFAYNLLSNN